MTYYNNTYILEPSKFSYKISDHFPRPVDGKVGISLSGGMESTLIARIAIDVYGDDNVVLLYSDDMFTANSPEGNKNVLANVTNAGKLLNKELIYCPVDTALHETDKITSMINVNKMLKETYNIEFTMWGFTKLFFDVAEFKQDPNATSESIVEKCYKEPEKYRSVIEEFHLPTGEFSNYIKELDIPANVYTMLKFDAERTLKRPFKDLNKSEVVDLYRQLDYLDLVYKTRSCVGDAARDEKHCGDCFNCQQRHDAFAKLGLVDTTLYKSEKVKIARKKLEEIL
jgi:GMP synthase PP-ATPase subunit